MRGEVLQNMIHFKRFWLEHEMEDEIDVYLSPDTGELFPAAAVIVGKEKMKKELKRAKLRAKEKEKAILLDPEGKFFDLSKVLGSRVLEETLYVLKEMIETFKKNKALFHTHSFFDRVTVERLLKDQKKGTYLITEGDSYLDEVARRLSETNQKLVLAYLFSILEEKERLTQHLLLLSKSGWTFFQDDPNLESPSYRYFSNLGDLLKTVPPETKEEISLSLVPFSSTEKEKGKG